MTRDQIIALAKKGAAQSATSGFATTNAKKRHLARMLELRREAADRKAEEARGLPIAALRA